MTDNEVGLELTGERILVRPPVVDETTRGGIIIPQMTLEKEERAATTGILIAAGPKAMDHPNMTIVGRKIQFGDNLFFARYAGDNVPITKNGVIYKVMNAADVVGVLNGELDSQFQAAITSREAFGLADQPS